MLKTNKIIKKTELLTMLTWLKSDSLLKNKPFNYDLLIDECHNFETPDIDISDNLDFLMCDLFSTYQDLKSQSPEKISEKLLSSFSFLSKEVINESIKSINNFITIYENIIMNYKFDNIQMRNTQKTIITILISKYTKSEEYEKCVELTQKLSEI